MSGIGEKMKSAANTVKETLLPEGNKDIEGTPLDTGSADTTSFMTHGGHAGAGSDFKGPGQAAAGTGESPDPIYTDQDRGGLAPRDPGMGTSANNLTTSGGGLSMAQPSAPYNGNLGEANDNKRF